jgi:hypothetical protein
MATIRLAVGLVLFVWLDLCAPAKADVLYSMYGMCVDCILDAPPAPPVGIPFIASLTVTDSYVGGTPLANVDFVSFTYGGSNLVPGFTYSADDPLALPFSLSGILPPTPPLPRDGTPIPLSPGGFGFTILDFPTGCGPLLGVTVGPQPCVNPELTFAVVPNQFWTISPGGSPADFGPLLAVTAAQVVPSPATLTLFGIALIGLGALRAWKPRVR